MSKAPARAVGSAAGTTRPPDALVSLARAAGLLSLVRSSTANNGTLALAMASAVASSVALLAVSPPSVSSTAIWRAPAPGSWSWVSATRSASYSAVWPEAVRARMAASWAVRLVDRGLTTVAEAPKPMTETGTVAGSWLMNAWAATLAAASGAPAMLPEVSITRATSSSSVGSASTRAVRLLPASTTVALAPAWLGSPTWPGTATTIRTSG